MYTVILIFLAMLFFIALAFDQRDRKIKEEKNKVLLEELIEKYLKHPNQ